MKTRIRPVRTLKRQMEHQANRKRRQKNKAMRAAVGLK